MNDKNLRAEELANKLFTKTITPEEEQELNFWYNQNLDDQVEVPHGFVSSEEEHRERILEAINVGIGKRRVVRLWPKVAVAVAAVAAIVVGVYFFNASRHVEGSVATRNLLVNDIAPGKNGATITLANGQVIDLSNAKNGVVVGEALKYSDGSDVRYSSGSRSSGSLKGSQSSTGPVGVHSLTPAELQGADGKAQILMAATGRGQTYQFTLPDGTMVWLNADSKLEFPSSFMNSKARNVKLFGEGYFEVAKDKKHPFIVETDRQHIEVLGTHFNVNSYADEPDTRTTLLEGSVQVTPKQVTPKQAAAKAQVMKPGQQAILDRRFDMQLKQVTDPDYFIAWRASGANDPGSMAFDNNTLEEVMRSITRWYNVTVEYRGNVKRDIRFSGMIKRNVPLSKVLRLLEATTGTADFKIEGRRLIVMN